MNVKMLRFVFATFFIVSCVSGYSVVDDDMLNELDNADELEWTDTFTVKITKYSLTSNLVEDIQIWQTNTSSRIDYNGGAVMLVYASIENDDGTNSLHIYDIHPETLDGRTPAIICNKGVTFKMLKKASILNKYIGADSWVAAGNETINDKPTLKFEDNFVSIYGQEVRKVVWAYYEDYEGVWIPVKFELKMYNPTLGGLTSHEILEFSEFSTDVDEDAFVMDELCGSDNTTTHSMESDEVTRELMFIDPHDEDHVDYVFGRFIENFDRVYEHAKEHALRRAIFLENMRMIATVNRKKLGYTLAINHFSDRTPEELEMSRGLKRRPKGKKGNVAFPYQEEQLKSIVLRLPAELDLRLYGLVGPVKNQADCGSCWTYGTTAALEGALARINGGKLLRLANQALVDCVWSKYGGNGCEGGTDNAAYEWMIDNGMPTEEEYGPYKNKDDFCRIANMTRKYRIRGFTDVTPFNNYATKVAIVFHGPLSTSLHATKQFMQYSRGVFYDYNCSSDRLKLNHEVTLVGYAEKAGELFWTIKNSYGPDWGIDGYMHISAKNNNCGVTTEPTFVVI